jgi:hypothetical protein
MDSHNALEQFNLSNTSERKILCFLQPEIESYIKLIYTVQGGNIKIVYQLKRCYIKI